jgi:N-acetylmuramoyl-L-alanine amidase
MLLRRIIFAVVVLLSATLASAGTTVENIRVWAENGRTRVVLDLSRPAAHKIFTLRSPDRLVIDLEDGRLSQSLKELPEGGGSVSAIRSGVRANGQLRVVIDLSETVRSRSFAAGPNSKYGDRLVIDLQRYDNLTTVKRASEKYVRGRDVVIAIDAGHGGHDPGAVGRGKTKEKDVALAISRLLARRINAESGMKAILVRNSDRYVDHRARMEVARRNKADLFVSIHADAVDDRRANGASVYVLSLKGASDEAAQRLAQRENATTWVGDVSLAGKDEVLASVLLDLSQNAALGASLDVGDDVIRELSRIGKVHRRKVQQAGFLVLKSPDVPSILVETAYISNPAEEKKLRSSSHQNKLANAILIGVRNYFQENPPPDTQIALNQKKYANSTRVSHVIARGDTLSEIAERYHVSMAAIRAANKLASDNVRVGQKLQIPAYSGT